MCVITITRSVSTGQHLPGWSCRQKGTKTPLLLVLPSRRLPIPRRHHTRVSSEPNKRVSGVLCECTNVTSHAKRGFVTEYQRRPYRSCVHELLRIPDESEMSYTARTHANSRLLGLTQRVHLRMHAYVHAPTHTHRIYTHTHTQTQTHTHTHTHTYTHTYGLSFSPLL